MSYKAIVTKNSVLTLKLLEYLASHPDVKRDLPSGISYVVFSASDKELNEYNEKLVEQLKKDGKKVVKAIETKNTKNPWELNFLSA